MRSLTWTATTVVIIVMSSAVAGQKQSGPRPAVLITTMPNRGPIAFNQASVVDRIFSFDANGDDRIARDELPERMAGLVGRGDKNQDGFLGRDEVIAVVDTESPARRIQRFNARGAMSLAEIISDQKLPPETHARAIKIVSAHPVARTINAPASDELLAAMRVLLDDEDYENFVAAVARLRNTARVFVGGVVGGVVNTPAIKR